MFKGAAVVTALGIVFALVGTVIIGSSPQGPNAGDSPILLNVAVPLILIVTVFLLIVIAAVFKERESLLYRLPTVTYFRCGILLVISVLVIPPLNIGFSVAVYVAILGFALCLAKSELENRLRAVALCDGLLCLAYGQASRRAGAAGDLGAARFQLFMFGTIGSALCVGLAFLSTWRSARWLTMGAIIGYGVLCVHSAFFLLEGLNKALTFAFQGGGLDYSGVNCIESTFPSPAEWLLILLRATAQAPEYSGPPPAPAPCPPIVNVTVTAAPVDQVTLSAWDPHVCRSLDYQVYIFFVLLGVYVVAVIAVYLVFTRKSPARVVPVSTDEVTAVTSDGGEGSKDCPRSSVSKDKSRSSGLSQNSVSKDKATAAGASKAAKGILGGHIVPAAVFAMIVSGLLIWFWVTVLSCPVVTKSEASSTSSQGSRRLGNSSSGNSSSGNSSLVNGTLNTTNSSIVRLSNMTPTTSKRIAVACNATIVAPIRAIPKYVPSSCGCESLGALGSSGFITVAAEQFALTWCGAHMWAPVVLGVLSFVVHCYTASLAYSLQQMHEVQAKRLSLFQSSVIEPPPLPDAVPTAVALCDTQPWERAQAALAWKEAKRELPPEPIAELGINRMFSV